MKNFSIEKDGAKFQKKTDGRKTETITLEIPNMLNIKSGRSSLTGGFTMKTRETNGGFTLNVEAKVRATGKFKGNNRRLSDLLEEQGVSVKELEEVFSAILQNAVKGTFKDTKDLITYVGAIVGKVTGE